MSVTEQIMAAITCHVLVHGAKPNYIDAGSRVFEQLKQESKGIKGNDCVLLTSIPVFREDDGCEEDNICVAQWNDKTVEEIRTTTKIGFPDVEVE